MRGEHVLELVPDFELDATTSRMFGGRGRPGSYDLPYKRADRKLIAVELQDFADAVVDGREPEVTGETGLKDVALVYAILESGYLRQPVELADVVQDTSNAYQQEINESVGL